MAFSDSNLESPAASDVIRDYERASSTRGTWENHWVEIAERILPGWADSFRSNHNQNNVYNKGEKGTEKIFDSTASVALGRFAAILDSLLTPRNQTWHRLTADDEVLNRNRNVRLWFDEVTRILFKYRYSPDANFSAQNQISYQSLGAFGSQALFIDPLDRGGPGLRYKACHLGGVYFFENHQGLIDKVIRHFTLTARQALQKWGEDALPEVIVKQVKDNIDPQKEYRFIHCVKPREEYDPQRRDAKGKPFASLYVSIEGKVLLSEGGYNTFPYAASRYEQAPGEIYGRSPAMGVLPAIKTLNEEKKTVLKQGHRVVDPVLLAHDDGVVDTFSMVPGHVNYGGVSDEGRPLVQPLPTGNPMVGKELMDDERIVINDAFLVTLFQILVETPTMTATEVIERTREKGILIAPTVGRQQSEYLGMMIPRELDVLAQQGLLPPPPRMLVEAGNQYSIEYDSPLSRMQKAEEASGLMRSIEHTLNIVNVTQDPSPLDWFNFDESTPAVADIHGVPTKWMNTLEAVRAIREGRAEAMERQQAAQEAPGEAALIKAGVAAAEANQ